MTHEEQLAVDSRVEEAFNEGSKQMLEAMRDIYKMDTRERTILFGKRGLLELMNDMSPQVIFNTLNNKKAILDAYVEVGDVLVKDADDTCHDVVTYIYDDGSFDAIGYGGARQGRVVKRSTLKDMNSHKTGEHIKSFPLMNGMIYSWE